MFVYSGTKELFVNDVLTNSITEKLKELYKKIVGRYPGIAEERAFANSLHYMNDVMMDDNIPNNSGIAIEYKIPYTSKRIDFIISGKNEENINSAIIIELKQWSEAKIVSGKDGIVNTYVGNANRDVPHPSYQAWSYSAYIEDYNENVQQEKVMLYPCAYLHNYSEKNPPIITSEVFKNYIDKAPVFLSGDIFKLRNFIKKYIKYGDDKNTLYLIENGKIKPSKSLQDALGKMINGNKEFIMLDDQKVVYEAAIKMAKEAYTDCTGTKRCLIVKGGPGTGKSVIAINLLVDLTREDMTTFYATKNNAPRNVYAAKLTGVITKTRYNNMFKSSGSFFESGLNDVDVIIADEAHRLIKHADRYKRFQDNQIKEIIKAARCSIFFIDESQRIHIDDAGSVEEIKRYASDYGAIVEELELESQFRCNGSDGYLAWIDDVLEIRKTANDIFDIDYEFYVKDNPSEIRAIIEEKNKKNNKSRMLAGYCWEWNRTRDGSNANVHEVTIPEYDFEMSWNLSNDNTFAISEGSINQIGCIHTSQGLEFDYVGVIIGDDLRYENGHIVTDFTKRANSDHSLNGIKTMYKNDPEKALKIADEIIKNTYRTLMTRGMKGCYVYCTNKGLSDYLKMRINNGIKDDLMVAEEDEEYE